MQTSNFLTQVIFTHCMLQSASDSANCCQFGEIYKSAVTVHTCTHSLTHGDLAKCKHVHTVQSKSHCTLVTVNTQEVTMFQQSYACFAGCCCAKLRGLRNNRMCGSAQSIHNKYINNAVEILHFVKTNKMWQQSQVTSSLV